MLDIDPREGRPEGPPPAGPHVPRRHLRRAASSSDDEIKAELAAAHPYGEWLDDNLVDLDDLPRTRALHRAARAPSCSASRLFGYTLEELKILVAPMARTGAEAARLDGHRHADRRALATGPGCCSTTSSSCSPRSPTRRSTPSARSWSPRSARTIGPEGNLLEPGAERRAARSTCPARSSTTTSWPRSSTSTRTACPDFRPVVIRCLYPVAEGGAGLRQALDRACRARPPRPSPTAPTSSSSPTAARPSELAPIPSLLFTAAVHHHLIREKTRTQVGLVVETGEAREVHHICLLLGLRRRRPSTRTSRSRRSRTSSPRTSSSVIDPVKAVSNYIKARQQGRPQGDVQDGHLDGRVLHRRPDLRGHRPRRRSSSTSTSPARVSRLGGIGLDEIAEEVAPRHARRLPRPSRASGPTATSRSAASTSGAARASTTSSTPRRSSSSSTPPAPAATTSSRSTRRSSTTRPRSSPPCAACSGSSAGDRDRRSRSTRSSRSARSSSGSPPAPCATARSRPRRTRPWPSP